MIIVMIIILIYWPVSPHLKMVRMRIIMIVIILVMMTVLAPSESEDGEVMMMLVKILKMMVDVAWMVIKILYDNFCHRGLFAERQ